MQTNILNVANAIEYIENNLTQKLSLEIVAEAVHYSKYHLHHIFKNTVGLTIHQYVQRRKLTEAAKLLVFSRKPIIEIALISGYESQQSFSSIFKLMYKKSPKQYREEERFYPLQLKYSLNQEPTQNNTEKEWINQIFYATEQDIPAWIDLVSLVVDGFPGLDEKEYLEQLTLSIKKKQGRIIKDENTLIGALIFNKETGMIDFLGIHPQYRKREIAKVFLNKIESELLEENLIGITTFREGDKADPGYRKIFKSLGFTEAELLTEFGYPTQKFTLKKESLEDNKNG